ncbi:MAG: sugar phosphate nucleotidyltransferase [Verrucomicrobiota bacterium]
MHQAFILGAGLGMRLRPLTNFLPKPLVPLFHRPLAAWAVDACMRAGIRRVAINTHHLPDAWNAFPDRPEFAGCDFTLFHEPVLLETGGGLKNIESWIGDHPLLIHNGDIFSTLPLEKLIAAHEASGNPVTLALRTGGPSPHIAMDSTATHVTDIHGKLTGIPGTHTFSGIYCIDPEFLELIPSEKIISVIPAFLELARIGKLGCVVLDEGLWVDLGDIPSYLAAHRTLALAPFVHPDAIIAANATIGNSVIGPGAIVENGARLDGCVVWPGATVAAHENATDRVFCGETRA